MLNKRTPLVIDQGGSFYLFRWLLFCRNHFLADFLFATTKTVYKNRHIQHDTCYDLLEEGIDAHHLHPVGEDHQDQRTDHDSEDRALAALDVDAAQYNGCNDGKLHAYADGRVGRAEAPYLPHTRERSDRAAQDEEDHTHLKYVDTCVICSTVVAADRDRILPKKRFLLKENKQ
ncbi:hypothetical protein SDC9_150567 [bioreactor metagenome]|uniref:Uncharacterized protein n=1 Tax=bioreactor metagenome TaxID=1076179 RepID=A0A645EPR0_9ZZZZ